MGPARVESLRSMDFEDQHKLRTLKARGSQMTDQGIQRVLAAIGMVGMVMMIGAPLEAEKAFASDSTNTPTDSTSDSGDVQSRGLNLPNIAPPPPPPVQLPSTVPVIDSVRVVTRPPCDGRQLQPYQIAKPCARVTSTSSTPETNMQHKLQFKGKNLLGAIVSIANGPNDVRMDVPGALGDPVGCPPGACFETYVTTHQGTQRGPRTLQIKNPHGQTTTVQIEVVDGVVIQVPTPRPGQAAQPAQPRQLPPCPQLSPNPSGPTGIKPIPCR